MGLALLVGTVAILDFRRLRSQPASQLAAEFEPWTRAGFVIMLTTGPLLFSADVARYLHNPAFRFKMAFLFLALLSHFTIRRKATRLTAAVSLALWTCVVLGGRGIADFDI
jgi:hypothetical protein